MTDEQTPWQPLERVQPREEMMDHYRQHGLETDVQVWRNEEYEAIAHGYLPGHVHLSIKRYDRAPDMPWRHLQQIKLEICGLESEAIELYPAESRLVDNANQRHLWVALAPPPDGTFGELEGTDGRSITDLLVIPRDPRYLSVGWDHGAVTNDDAVKQYNDGDHPGKQEPWQPGLTTGRNDNNTVIGSIEVKL